MKRNHWTVWCIALFAVSTALFQGISGLDKILAEQVAQTWNDIYQKQYGDSGVESIAESTVEGDGSSTETTAEGDGSSTDYESKIIRNGAAGNNLCTFACNVDWGEEIIPDMLKVFSENNVKITFFVSGRWAEKNPELLRQMYEEGHEIQSHGYSHALCSDISDEKIIEEIDKTERAIIDAICVKPNFFAPPAGDYDSRTVKICEDLGYQMVLWTSDTIDWREGSYSDVIVNRIMSKPLDGAIILMHPKEETLKALPELISRINSQNCRIVPLYRMPVE